MKSSTARIASALALLVIGWLVMAAAAPKQAALQPDKLVIVSTTDVKGKTSPCG
jgi:hypothetical protein